VQCRTMHAHVDRPAYVEWGEEHASLAGSFGCSVDTADRDLPLQGVKRIHGASSRANVGCGALIS
jgi:hypothetical protein